MLEAKIENDPHSFSMVWPDAFLRAFLCSREHAILPKIAASKLLVSSDTLGLTASAGSVAWSCALETHQPRLVSVRKSTYLDPGRADVAYQAAMYVSVAAAILVSQDFSLTPVRGSGLVS